MVSNVTGSSRNDYQWLLQQLREKNLPPDNTALSAFGGQSATVAPAQPTTGAATTPTKSAHVKGGCHCGANPNGGCTKVCHHKSNIAKAQIKVAH
jgi:hypothetical protein